MKILVCVKQVPDMASSVTINAEGVWYVDEGLAFRLNEYDEYAVEEAVQLKEQLGGEPDLTILSIGPGRVKEAMRRAMAMGADRGVHIVDDEYYKKDSHQIASMIADFAKDKDFDLVFTGMQSQDRGSGQVGPAIAAQLDYACVTTLVGFEYEDGKITATRELEGGLHAKVKLAAPAVVTCQLGMNTPRYPTLPNIMKVKKKELLEFSPDDFASGDALVVTESMYVPEKKGAGLVLEGDAGEVAGKLLDVLKEKTSIVK